MKTTATIMTTSPRAGMVATVMTTKIIQIIVTAQSNNLYALDNKGQIWQKGIWSDNNMEWSKVTLPEELSND